MRKVYEFNNAIVEKHLNISIARAKPGLVTTYDKIYLKTRRCQAPNAAWLIFLILFPNIILKT
jgi:hypothetical protein